VAQHPLGEARELAAAELGLLDVEPDDLLLDVQRRAIPGAAMVGEVLADEEAAHPEPSSAQFRDGAAESLQGTSDGALVLVDRDGKPEQHSDDGDAQGSMASKEEAHRPILLRSLLRLLALLAAVLARRRTTAPAHRAAGRQLTTKAATTYDESGNLAVGVATGALAQFQHLGPTACDSSLTRACIATLNASVAAPSSDFTAGALTWSTTFDANGNVFRTVDPKAQVCLHSFGLLNRLERQDYSSFALPRELPSLDSVAYSYTPNGSLQTVVETKTTASGTVTEQTTRGFDALERMTSQTRDYGSTQKTTLFGYDTKGNRTSVTDSSGVATVYTFDSVDRLKTATTPNGIATHVYMVDGLLQRTEYRQSVGAAPTTVEKRCYDNASRLTTVASGPPSFMTDDCAASMGPVVFSRFDYGLDANGNRVAQNERRASTTELTEYGYDELDRLVATVEPSEAKLYELDAVGNRTGEKKTTPAAARLLGLTAAAFLALAPADTQAHVRGHFNRADWLTQRENVVPAGAPIDFLHDANGNTTSEQSATSLREYKWDSRNTLTAAFVDGLEAGRYSYDWQLQRVSRAAGGSTVEYVLDDKLVLQELDGTHSATRRYHFGALSPLGVSDSAGPRWLLNDGLGSVSDEVTPSGGLLKQRQYNAWGEYRNSTAPGLSEPKLGYEGHQYDSETGLTYARARYLDNRYGILLSRDVVEGSLNDAPSLHRYNWTRVNPLRFTDPDGNEVLEALQALFDWRSSAARGPGGEARAPVPSPSTVLQGGVSSTVTAVENSPPVQIAGGAGETISEGAAEAMTGLRGYHADGTPVTEREVLQRINADPVTSTIHSFQRAGKNLGEGAAACVGGEWRQCGRQLPFGFAEGAMLTSGGRSAGAVVVESKMVTGALATPVSGLSQNLGRYLNPLGKFEGLDEAIGTGLQQGAEDVLAAGQSPAVVNYRPPRESAVLDANALTGAFERGELGAVDAALAGRRPLVPMQAAKEYLRRGDVETLRSFLEAREGRMAAAGSEQTGRALQVAADWGGRVIRTGDSRVAASAMREGAPVMTRDKKFFNALKWLGVAAERY